MSVFMDAMIKTRRFSYMSRDRDKESDENPCARGVRKNRPWPTGRSPTWRPGRPSTAWVERVSTTLIGRSLSDKILGLKLVVELIELVWADAGSESAAIGNKLEWGRFGRFGAERHATAQHLVHHLLERLVVKSTLVFQEVGNIIV